MSKLFITALLIALTNFMAMSASENEDTKLRKVYGIHEDNFMRVPPPKQFLLKSAKQEGHLKIEVQYNDFPKEAIDAFNYAVEIWESLLYSDQVVYVDATWIELDGENGENVLGAAGSSDFYINKEGLPKDTIFYNAPLAEKLARRGLNAPGNPDLYAYFSSNNDWYFGTDGETPGGHFDFVTVVLHELCHGLGFSGSMDESDDENGIWGYGSRYPYTYDRFIVNGNNEHLVNSNVFSNPSSELLQQMTSDNLFFSGPVTLAKYGGNIPLYAPSEFDSGSSVDHISKSFNNGENSMMTPGIQTASSIHNPGVVTMSIMEEVGWTNLFFEHIQQANSENNFLLDIEIVIEPDFETAIVEPRLHYAVNNEDYVSIPLDSLSGSNLYTASVSFDSEAVVKYYFSAEDKYQREFIYPNSAPDEALEVIFGTDTVAPEIVHIANESFYTNEDNLVIIASVSDPFLVDTVYLEYLVNDIQYSSFGMKKLSDGRYNVLIDFDEISLETGDTILYRIVAKDASKAGNVAYAPEEGYYSLNVSNLPNFVTNYFSDFSRGSNDFIFDGFEFSVADGFADAALNSEHPYENGGNDTWLNFTAQLRFPVLIAEEYHYLVFDEIALIEPGESGIPFGDDDFYDYVVVEGSKDNGNTWIPFEDGYDCRVHAKWAEAYDQSQYFNNTQILSQLDLFHEQYVDMTNPEEFNPGDTVLIRFRLHSDPFAVGWGWAIDNLKVQEEGLTPPVSSSATSTLASVKVFPNPAINGRFTLNGISTGKSKLEIYDFMGKKVYQQSEVINNQEIVVPHELNGLHILIVQNDEEIYRSKLLFR